MYRNIENEPLFAFKVKSSSNDSDGALKPAADNYPEPIRINLFKCPEIVFVVLASFFGLLFTIITPPFQVADEYAHFEYAYAISIGQLDGYTSIKPASMQHLREETLHLPFHPENKINFATILKNANYRLDIWNTVPTSYQDVSKYNPFPYIPQVMAIEIGKLFILNPLDFFYFGRVFSLLIWIVITYNAIKLLPGYKWAFLLLLLTPMSLSLAASYSADSIQNSLAFLWICLCLHYSTFANGKISSRGKILLVILAVFISLLKPPYIFLLGLYLLIPRSLFESKRQYLIITFSIIFLAIFFLLLSLSYLKNDTSMTARYEGVDLFGQLVFIINNPIDFIKAILRTFMYDWKFIYFSYVGILGWLDTKLPEYIYVLYFIFIVIVSVSEKKINFVFGLWHKLILLFTASITSFMVLFSLYLTWTIIGDKTVYGVVGRYFIPIMPLIILLLSNQRLNITEKKKGIMVFSFLFIILSLTVRTLVIRYYVY